jgi:hypothetical protein
MRATRSPSTSWRWLEELLAATIRQARNSPQTREHFLDLLEKGPSRTVHSRKGRAKSMMRRSR